MITWALITNDIEEAINASNAGVNRIFVDWEVHGKHLRQGHLNTFITDHSYEDVIKIREAVPDNELLVRVNPVNEKTEYEVEKAISSGADLIMLPMFTEISELQTLTDIVDGRVGIVPLIETKEALNIIDDVVSTKGLYEIFIGLNDLHMSLNMKFMFEPVANGMLEYVAQATKKSGVRFGFGGVARIGEGLVPGEMVLSEHLRLGSESVILSRTFNRPDEDKRSSDLVFKTELAKLIECEKQLAKRSSEEIDKDHQIFVDAVNQVVNS